MVSLTRADEAGPLLARARRIVELAG
jgi:hypothetical protein